MIIAAVKDAHRYLSKNEKMQKAFDFLKENDLESLKVGKHLIDGNDVFALVQEYNTKEEEKCRFESHKRYIDIQVLVKGTEKMKWLHLESLELIEDDFEKSDKAFYKEKTSGNEFTVHAGEFVIFYPEDGHKACIYEDKSSFVKKIVLKVSL